MGKTLIVFAGKYGGDSAGAKRVRQFAIGLRSTGDDAAVVGYYRGTCHSEVPILWSADRWGVPHAGVGIAEGSLKNLRVAIDAMTLSSRLGELAARACRELAFDRVLLYGTNWFAMRSVIWRLSQLRLPIVADFNEWMLCKGGRAMEFFGQGLFRRLCVPRLAGMVGISPFWEDYAARVGKPILLIPAMADDEFAELAPNCGNEFSVVYVGILFHRDLPETMLAGVRLAIERGVHFKFNVIGRPGSFPESVKSLRRIEADPLLRKRVHIHGWVSHEQLRRIYAEAGSFLLLRGNDWESLASFPTRLPEFLSTGTPVITSNTKSFAMYLRHRENAWLLPAGHAPEELAAAICHLAAHHDERMRIGQAGRKLATTKLFFRNQGQRLRQFLDALQGTGARL